MDVLIKRCAALCLTISLAACGGIMEGDLFDSEFWGQGPAKDNTLAELGLAEMAKGNYVSAEGYYQRALKKNSKDVHALMGLGIIYQNTGQTTKAREMYEAILAIRPPESEQFVVWKNISTRPISEIASVNLALLESGGVLDSMGRGEGVSQPMVNRPMGQGGQGGGAPQMSSPQVQSVGQSSGRSSMETPMAPMMADADLNIAYRFKTMISLRDQGLITQGEFDTRRQANIGALLPLTSPPPATGLDRPVPATEQISGRLRAIGRGLEMRAISVSQHSAERTMILDALMPSAPVSVANPGPPPQGLLEAADSVRRLEQLNADGLITSDEYAREREAIEMAMQPAPMKAPKPMAAAPAAPVTPLSPAEMEASDSRPSGPRPAVHLASYRSRKAADRGWAQLRRAYKELLGGMKSEVTKVNLGPGKGIFYRLKAGPLQSEGAASSICSKLKRRRQYCEPSFMNSG